MYLLGLAPGTFLIRPFHKDTTTKRPSPLGLAALLNLMKNMPILVQEWEKRVQLERRLSYHNCSFPIETFSFSNAKYVVGLE